MPASPGSGPPFGTEDLFETVARPFVEIVMAHDGRHVDVTEFGPHDCIDRGLESTASLRESGFFDTLEPCSENKAGRGEFADARKQSDGSFAGGIAKGFSGRTGTDDSYPLDNARDTADHGVPGINLKHQHVTAPAQQGRW